MSPCEGLISELRARGHRLTPQREMIVEAVAHAGRHVTAEEVFEQVQAKTLAVNIATVYRTLDLLARMGIITKLTLGDGQSRYEFKSSEKKDHHHHLICTTCGRIINYSEFLDEELRLVKKTEERLAKKYDFKILDHNIEFFGMCGKCK